MQHQTRTNQAAPPDIFDGLPEGFLHRGQLVVLREVATVVQTTDKFTNFQAVDKVRA